MIDKFEIFEVKNIETIYGGCCAGVICNITGEWIPDKD